MEASTLSAIAGSTSAVIAAVSATIAAVSAVNSRKSAQASVVALRETREQRQLDNARVELNAIAALHDDVFGLIEALRVDLSRDPAAVERARAFVRRSMVISGVTSPALDELVSAGAPPSSAGVDRIRAELTARSAELRAILTRGPAE
ncbi:hypothetical protein [Micromonospora sp. RL09-050-HVF-A]|uniref:hypothetical protein n=1 Tax=Micromonospora sp. RL09-050-HVF-A TaxID=1703433 RepID=UPI001C5DE592|nr:hypothetical protein [Micromonospora sp. RL09-050-HVF-A]MBW4705198.1 hypothetical protein [Micromonospora sp. RL09-050-HVF-A]